MRQTECVRCWGPSAVTSEGHLLAIGILFSLVYSLSHLLLAFLVNIATKIKE